MENEDTWQRFTSCRWRMAALLFTGVMSAYTLRVNMSVAAQDMRDELDWSEGDKGTILSSFYWGYALGQVPASRLIHQFGARNMFAIAVAVPSLLSMLFPMVARDSFGGALFLRALIGFFEAACFPSVFHYFPLWVPLKEKSFMIPTISSGMYLGTVIGFSLSGILCSTDIKSGDTQLGSWDSVFYFFGLWGLIWLPFWLLFAYEKPEQHPNITPEELAFIREGKGLCTIAAELTADLEKTGEINLISNVTNFPVARNPLQIAGTFEDSANTLDEPLFERRQPSSSIDRASEMLLITPERSGSSDVFASQVNQGSIPYGAFLTHPVSLTLLANSWASGFIGFTLLSEMPAYFSDELGFDLSSAAALCVFPYIALLVAAIGFGTYFQYLQIDHGWPTDRVRRVSHFIAMIGASVVLVICGFISQKYVAYLLVILTQVMSGASQVSLGCAYSDVAPNYSSALNSLGNTLAAVAGIVGPLLVAALIESSGLWGWRLVFIITFIQAALAMLLWHIYQTSEVVPELNTAKKTH